MSLRSLLSCSLPVLCLALILPGLSARAGDASPAADAAASAADYSVAPGGHIDAAAHPITAAIWSCLVLATNDPHPTTPPTELRPYTEKLKDIFGYNQFEVIGQNSQKIAASYEHWLIPSKDFCVSVRTHPQPGEPYALKMALYQNRRHLADFDAHLGAESPLFIKGPQYAHGQLIIVLYVVDPAAAH